VLNICTGRATSLNKLFAALHTHYPDAPTPAYAPARRGDIRHSRGDPALAQNTLDFSAVMSLEEGLASFLANQPTSKA
jgi:UDP-glucose 4-epimerase